MPWVMVFAPMLLAVPMALFFGPRYLLFALFSLLMAIANFVRRSGGRAARTCWESGQKEHDEELARSSAWIPAPWRPSGPSAETGPDAATLLGQAIGPGPRAVGTPGLRPRLPARAEAGLTDLPATVTVEERRSKTAEAAPARRLAGVPAWLDLTRLGVVGLAGEDDTREPLAHWLVAQVALLHSPRDVRVTVLSDQHGESVGLGPVAAARLVDADTVLLGTEQDSVARRLAELAALVDARTELVRDKVRPVPDVLVVLDGARWLRTLPAVVDLLRRGPGASGCGCSASTTRSASCPRSAGRSWSARPDGSGSRRPWSRPSPPSTAPGPRRAALVRDRGPAVSCCATPPPRRRPRASCCSARLLELIDLDPPTPEGIGALTRGA